MKDRRPTEMNTRRLNRAGVRRFREKIYAHYERHARSLPWRENINSYGVVVSEIMLQQTQVERVLVKYDAFMSVFPDFYALARASLQDVLAVWSGLGYNRRARYVREIAGRVVDDYGGLLPSEPRVLETFPGIGAATAASIVAFAFDKPVVFLETNIRTVFIHFFCAGEERVSDCALLPLVAQTLDYGKPRLWYYALMDYGSMLKKRVGNESRRSTHYVKQSPFQGSRRQTRGRVLRALLRYGRLSEKRMAGEVGTDLHYVRETLKTLECDGMIKRKRGMVSIA
jgi:A/G-specific adenine glycosylase